MQLHPLFFPSHVLSPSKATMVLPNITGKRYTQKIADEKPADGGFPNWKTRKAWKWLVGFEEFIPILISPTYCFSDNYYCSTRSTNISLLCLKAKLCIIHVNKSVSKDYNTVSDIIHSKSLSVPKHTLYYRYKNISFELIRIAESAHSYAFLITLTQIK